MSHTPPSTSKKRLYESNLEFFRTRLTARLCIALTCFIQFIPRFATIFGSNITSQSQKISLYSIPFAPAISLIVAIEYILFKKKGPEIVKYSKIVDLIILFIFIVDWIAVLISSVVRIQQTDPPSFQISSLYGFASFAWRSLLVTLIVQKWQLKIIAPVITLIVATGYAIHYDPKYFYFYLLRVSTQLFNIVLIIYCEDKLKWRMMWNNLEQVKWVQVNDFILNNIPENIMILDFKGEAKFISDYCRNFIKKCHLSLDTKDFFGKIQDLKEQESEPAESPSPSNTLQIERLTTVNGVLIDNLHEDNVKAEILTDLIMNFRIIMKEKNLQERQFLAFNGKLKMDNPQEQDKCIEIKISFVQHFNNEYIILILRDTTQRDLLVTLQETNKYKDQLLASVSHELRAPLNGNINLVEAAVNSPKIPDEIKENLLIPAMRSSMFLLHIINDILDMSQIKERKLRLVFQSGDLKETIKSTTQLVELQAKMKGIELSIELDPNLPQTFCTDHMRLSQIVLNLLNNAIKFTQEGTVKLKATLLHSETSSYCVKVSVEDSGIGMSQENLQKLFISYTHIEFETRHIINPAGVGLGLNIASNLVQLLSPTSHQNISVTSTPNQGSIFSFIVEDKEKLPLDLDEVIDLNKSSNISWEVADELPGDIQPAFVSKFQTTVSSQSLASQKPNSKAKSLCSCPRILIVDDNPFNTMAFETILSSLEIKCDSVYSGSSAIKKVLGCESKRCGKDCRLYSVVFMDQEMPEMSGPETVKEIRRLQKENLVSKNMRIIGCTAHKSKEEVERFMAAGLDECIHKPISVTMIKDIL